VVVVGGYLSTPFFKFSTSSSLQRRFRDTEESSYFFAWLVLVPLPPPPRRSLGLKEEPAAGLESRSGALAGEPPETPPSPSASSSVLHCNSQASHMRIRWHSWQQRERRKEWREVIILG
jgi:hypothetical protein